MNRPTMKAILLLLLFLPMLTFSQNSISFNHLSFDLERVNEYQYKSVSIKEKKIKVPTFLKESHSGLFYDELLESTYYETRIDTIDSIMIYQHRNKNELNTSISYSLLLNDTVYFIQELDLLALTPTKTLRYTIEPSNDVSSGMKMFSLPKSTPRSHSNEKFQKVVLLGLHATNKISKTHTRIHLNLLFD